MKPAAFDFTAVVDAAAAAGTLRERAGQARLMAGGQSLGPMMNLRLARPDLVVDISRVPALRSVRENPGAIIYGAAITHAQIEDGDVPDATPGWLSAVARHIAYRAVRNRGTIGGSLAHADPAADWVNVLSALDAAVHVCGPQLQRRLALSEFFKGPFATALSADEVIVEVEVPRRGADALFAYKKFCRKAGDFSQASAVALRDPAKGEVRLLLGAIERPPVLLPDPAECLADPRSIDERVAAALPERTRDACALHAAAVREVVARISGPQVQA